MKNRYVFIMSFLFFAHFLFGQEQKIKKAFGELYGDLFEADEPGGSILVMKGKDILFQGNYGVADIQTGEKITENTIFNTGSISKTFVSNGILILNERKKLSLDDPISKYFGDFDKKEIAEKVTIAHLLSHSSGLPDIRNVRNHREHFITARDKENWEPIKRTEAFNFEPGSNFQYSNPAFNALALIIEQVSGKKWQSFIREEIFKPSGMENSEITDGPLPDKDVAHAYIDENGKFVESDYGEVPTFAAAGNGGIWSSVMELAQYEKAIRAYTFLSEKMIDQSRSPCVFPEWDQFKDPKIGYSWFLGEDSLFGTNELGVDIVYHTGSQGGFRAFYITIPEKDILYMALFNRPFDAYRDVMRDGLRILKEANWMD